MPKLGAGPIRHGGAGGGPQDPGAGPIGPRPPPPPPLSGAGPAGTLVANVNVITRFALVLLSTNAPASIDSVNAVFEARVTDGVSVTVELETTTESEVVAKVTADPPAGVIVMFLSATADTPSENVKVIGLGPLPALFNGAKVVIPASGSEASKNGLIVSTPVVNE